MAAPQGQLRAGRYFLALVAILAVLAGLVLFTGGGNLKPRLGLDLQGGTTVTLSATTADGKAPPQDRLAEARQIIENRVNGLGVAEAEVVIEGDRNIVVSVPGQSRDDVKQIGAPAQLFFREVLKTQPDIGATADEPSPSASPSASVPPSASASASAKPAASATPAASAPAGPSGSAAAASALPSTAPSAPPVKLDPQLVAAILQEQVTPEQLLQATPQLKPLTDLTPAQLATVDANILLKVPQITCKKLSARPAGSISQTDRQVVACGDEGKYLLDKPAVLGTDVKGASFDPAEGGGWRVTMSFTGSGQGKWTDLTKKTVGKQVAIVLDNDVVSAPEIKSVIAGDAEITGTFTRAEAATLASKIKFGALPLTFGQSNANSVSPTLGLEQLKAGLLAGGIGIGLVFLYVLFYYRLLGLVTIASLVLSGVVIYAVLILLGRRIGFALSLAGVAGFIVSIGITADSFVVFFERLKDEIRDGRTPRSAVPRAWVRARRTIISADTVSFLAAAVLYFLAVGAVKGFAFTLGMSTVLDLIVVFLFTHPLVALMSRSRTFMSPRVSGLGQLTRASSPPVPGRRGRPAEKEA